MEHRKDIGFVGAGDDQKRICQVANEAVTLNGSPDEMLIECFQAMPGIISTMALGEQVVQTKASSSLCLFRDQDFGKLIVRERKQEMGMAKTHSFNKTLQFSAPEGYRRRGTVLVLDSEEKFARVILCATVEVLQTKLIFNGEQHCSTWS